MINHLPSQYLIKVHQSRKIHIWQLFPWQNIHHHVLLRIVLDHKPLLHFLKTQILTLTFHRLLALDVNIVFKFKSVF